MHTDLARDMLQTLFKIIGLKQQVIVSISENELSVTDINSRKIELRPRISKHSRSIIGDFNAVEKELKSLMSSVFPRQWVYTEVIIVLSGQNQGGYTAVERRAARELAYGATGAHVVYISELPVSNDQAARVFKGEKIEHELSDA